MTENEKYLYNRFLINVKSGLMSFEDIIDDALEALDDEGWQNEISEEWVHEAIQREHDKNEIASKVWQQPTHTQRLHDVFDKLCRQGVIALHNAGYTTSDAVYDAQEVWKDVEDAGGKPIGYCYYHGQDLERVVIESGSLFIGFYGEKANNDKDAIQIGYKVMDMLKDAGFEVKWNGTATQRIEVLDFEWQNTFISDDDVEQKWGYSRVLELMGK